MQVGKEASMEESQLVLGKRLRCLKEKGKTEEKGQKRQGRP